MKADQSIFTYLLIFLILCVIAKIFNLISITYSGIFGYALIFYGISEVYSSLGTRQKIKLFTGTTSFLIGMYLFLINNFILFNTKSLILPLALFIISAVSFIYLLDEFGTQGDNSASASRKNRLTYFLISIIFLILGIIVIWLSSPNEKVNFITAIQKVAASYWPIILIAAGIIFLIRKR